MQKNSILKILLVILQLHVRVILQLLTITCSKITNIDKIEY